MSKRRLFGAKLQVAASNTAVVVDVITDIDKDTRTITLKDPVSGEKWIFNAGPEVKNFDQLKRGDLVLTEYYEGLAVALAPKGSGLKDRVTETNVERADPVENPVYRLRRQPISRPSSRP